MKSSTRGVSLLELLVVVGVAMLAASWVLPRLLGSGVAVDELSTINNINFITDAQRAYRAAYPQIGYADRLEKLARRSDGPCRPTPQLACLLDPSLATADLVLKEGYYINLFPGSPGPPRTSYVVVATVAHAGKDGNHNFCATEDGAVHCLPVSSSQAPDQVTWSACRALPRCFY